MERAVDSPLESIDFRKKILKELTTEGESSFASREYQKSLEYFLKALSYDSNYKPAKIGILLLDMIQGYEDEAHALHDYYEILKKDPKNSSEDLVLNAIKNFDDNLNRVAQFFSNINTTQINAIDGILYDDFKKLESQRGGFKRAFEDIMYSTKIIIQSHEDFVEFMNKLVDYGFKDVALSYLENGVEQFMFDKDLREILNKINRLD